MYNLCFQIPLAFTRLIYDALRVTNVLTPVNVLSTFFLISAQLQQRLRAFAYAQARPTDALSICLVVVVVVRECEKQERGREMRD